MLGHLLADIHHKVTDALLQTQEFQQVADNLERWVTGTLSSLKSLELPAARVKLVEPQIEGFKVSGVISRVCSLYGVKFSFWRERVIPFGSVDKFCFASFCRVESFISYNLTDIFLLSSLNFEFSISSFFSQY